jgi:hypothetical protein
MRRGLGRLVFFTLMGTAGAAAAQAPPAPSPPPEKPAVKVTPYGIVFFNGYTNTGAVNNTDVPLWAVAGSGGTGATARQTRVGVRVAVPDALGARLSGVVEADFFGGFPAIGTGDNFGQLRVRLANARLDWTKTSLVLGQDWMVFAPQNPASLACAGIPLFAGAGNPWARLPQVRVEYRGARLLGQLAVLSPSSGDFSSAFLAQPSSGMSSKVPFVQGRVALTSKSWRGTEKPGTIGASGHAGRSRVVPATGAARSIDSLGAALDWSLPFGRQVTFTGEAFLGTNLAGFQSAIFQGLNPDAVTVPGGPGAAGGIGTKGGWAQLGFTPRGTRVTLHAGYGIDDPDDEDLVSATRREWRLRNQVLALGVTHRSSPHLAFGLEYRYLRSTLLLAGTQDGSHLNLAATFTF